MSTEFYKPTDLKTAVELLNKHQGNAVIVNGGTDIVIEINEGKRNPGVIVSVSDIKELKGISKRDGKIVIGGAVTYSEMLSSPVIKEIPGLFKAIGHLASPGIRQVATPAGNIGTAAPSADCTTMLMGLAAKIVAVCATGERVIPIEEFFVCSYKTVLKPNEIIKEIFFDAPQKNESSGYIRLARRKAQDIAKIIVSASLTVKDGVCTKAIIGFGALNPTAVRATSVEKAIVGKKKEEALAYVRENFPKEAGLRPSRFECYKRQVVPAAVERAVEMAWNNAEGGQ